VLSEALSVEDEAFGAFGEALGDDLGVERVGEDLGLILEEAVGGESGRAAVVVAVGENLKGELGLGRIHLENGEVVDHQELGLLVAAQSAVEAAVELGAVEVVEHPRRRDEHDPAVGLAGAIGESASRATSTSEHEPGKSFCRSVQR
jgi:hypothetical protein